MNLTDMARPSPGRCLALLLAAAGCGGGEPERDAASPPASSAAPSTSPAEPEAPPPFEVPPEAVEAFEALTNAIGMAADQLQVACGAAFDLCAETTGCDQILACAARNTCSGMGCYCLDAECQTPGPCRAVIEMAPGARAPDEADPSLGPAADAATGVGDCLRELGSDLPPPPPPSGEETAGEDAG